MHASPSPLPRNELGSVRRFFSSLFWYLAMLATVLFGIAILLIIVFDGFFGLFAIPKPGQVVFILERHYQSLLIHLFGSLSVLWLIYHIIRDNIEMIFWFMALFVTAVVLQMFHQ